MRMKRHCLAVLGLLTLAGAAAAGQARDVILGNGTVGPYALAWKQIDAGTDSVQVNTLAQTRGLDYTLDTAAGTITFTSPLPLQAAAEVQYQYDPKHAVHTGANLAIPLSLDIARGEHGSLSLDATYKRTGDAPDTNPGTLAVGLGGGWQDARGQLTTRLLFAPQTQTGSSQGQADSLARAGLALSGSTQVSPVAQFSFGYSRIGTDLGSVAGDNGWQTGVQTLTLGSSFTPSQKVAAFVNYSQADPLTAGPGMTTKLATGLTVTPLSALQLQTHWTQSLASGATTDAMDFSLSARAAPSKAVSLQAQLGQTNSDQSGTTQTAAVVMSAQPTRAAQVNASYALNNAPGLANDTQTINLAAKLAPGSRVTVNAGVGQTRQGAAATDRQQIALALTPRSTVQLHTGVVLSQTDQYATTAANFGGAIQPVSFLQFSADYTSRCAPGTDAVLQDSLDSSAAQVAFTPLKGLRVTGHYAQNPGDGGSLQRLAQRGVGLETTVGAVSLTGGYDWSRQYDTPSVGTTLNLGLGLRLSRALQITGGYKQSLSGLDGTPAGTSLYSFGLTHSLGDRFNLSMNGTMQQQTGLTDAASPDYTASANLGMKF